MMICHQFEKYQQVYNLISEVFSLLFSIYYDDPYSVAKENCTSDLCFTVKKEIEHPDFKMNLIKGGKYAVFRSSNGSL